MNVIQTALVGITALLAVAAGPDNPSAAEVLKRAISALSDAHTVEYTVRSEHTGADGNPLRGSTRIVARRGNPFQYRARFESEDKRVVHVAVSDGSTIRGSEGGEMRQAPAFVDPGKQIMVTLNFASAAFIRTWRALLDRSGLEAAIAEGNVLRANQDDIDGDLCHVVLVVQNFEERFGHMCTYYWFSVKTGLPRAAQNLWRPRGVAKLSEQFIISDLKLNPDLDSDAFSMTLEIPKSAQSADTKHAEPARDRSLLIGRALPNLELRDSDYRAVKLSAYRGRPLILDFWAPWCGPCLGAFPMLEKIRTSYAGKLRIVAVAVQDSRINVKRFLDDNANYSFTFLLDPDMQAKSSRIEEFFRIDGLPLSVFVSAEGEILDVWQGAEQEFELVERISKLMKNE